jgi:hypothetical protein
MKNLISENAAYQPIDTNTISHFGITVSILHRAAYIITSAQSFKKVFLRNVSKLFEILKATLDEMLVWSAKN